METPASKKIAWFSSSHTQHCFLLDKFSSDEDTLVKEVITAGVTIILFRLWRKRSGKNNEFNLEHLIPLVRSYLASEETTYPRRKSDIVTFIWHDGFRGLVFSIVSAYAVSGHLATEKTETTDMWTPVYTFAETFLNLIPAQGEVNTDRPILPHNMPSIGYQAFLRASLVRLGGAASAEEQLNALVRASVLARLHQLSKHERSWDWILAHAGAVALIDGVVSFLAGVKSGPTTEAISGLIKERERLITHVKGVLEKFKNEGIVVETVSLRPGAYHVLPSLGLTILLER